MIKILNVVSSLDSGGVEQMLYNYYSRFDKDKFKFEFAVYSKIKGSIEQNLEEYGCKIYHITPRKKSLFKNLYDLFKIIKNGNYDIIYSHMNHISWIALFYGWIFKVKIRISHAHGCKKNKLRFPQKFTNKICEILIHLFGNYFFACGEEAGKYVYGKFWNLNNKKYKIIKNAIYITNFEFSYENRIKLRNEYNINNKICLLHIGRFSKEKNHEFLFNLMNNIDRKKYILLCIGDGPLLENYKKTIPIKLKESIIFLGKKNDIGKFYSMADCLVFPSLNEGLGMTVIESQVSNLKCICSNYIPREVKINENVIFVPLKLNEWKNEIENLKEYERISKNEMIKLAGYDIVQESKKFEELLLNICNQK